MASFIRGISNQSTFLFKIPPFCALDDNLFHGNYCTNVKDYRLSSTKMKTLCLALRESVVKRAASVHPSETHQNVWHCRFFKRRLATKQTLCLKSDIQWEHQFSVAFIFSKIMRNSEQPELRSNFHLHSGGEGTDIYHNQHLQGSTAYSNITLIAILWEVIPLTLLLKEVHSRHESSKTNHIHYLRRLIKIHRALSSVLRDMQCTTVKVSCKYFLTGCWDVFDYFELQQHSIRSNPKN